MKARLPGLLVAIAAQVACGSQVAVGTTDGGLDAGVVLVDAMLERGGDEPDARDASDAADEPGDAWTSPQPDADAAAADVRVPWGTWDPAHPEVAHETQDTPAPSGVGRSCEGLGPVRDCQEVHYDGGWLRLYQPDGVWVDPAEGYPSTRLFAEVPMRAEERRTVAVRSGWADAYEVTVRRFRAWRRAGSPAPTPDEEWAPGQRGFSPLTWARMQSYGFEPERAVPGAYPLELDRSDACTYTETPGANEDLPVNCVRWFESVAFCRWDGKHLMTHFAWEYVAKNRDTTHCPVGDYPSDDEACRIGDAGGHMPACPPTRFPHSVFSRPLDRTQLGVFGMFGGLQELVFGDYSFEPWGMSGFPAVLAGWDFDTTPGLDSWDTLLGRGGFWDSQRGAYESLKRSSSARYAPVGNSPYMGFRCARWEGEVHPPL